MVSEQLAPMLVPALQLSATRLALLLSYAYADYFLPVWVDAEQFRRMCRVEDVDLAESVVALVMDEPAGLALLARRGARGWISGVGVLPVYRRHGIARHMVRTLQQRAPSLGLERLTLEVLVQNAPGLSLYRELGFRARRKLLVLTLEEPTLGPAPLPEDIVFLAPDKLLTHSERFHKVRPSWQRERLSLARRTALHGLARYDESGKMEGYLLYEEQPRHQAIYDLGVVVDHPQRTAVAQNLLLALHRLRPGVGGHFVNLPATEGLLDAFLHLGYRIWHKQYEMVWEAEETIS
ncbi:MAG: GNAT family N-acetyltransferase [Anaerolineae bacterium]